ncbi:hypothetical protein Dcar01_02690 [Deinococcus carri]|uniref:Diguanylate cyclase n=1 Tax=Deinococcus carri TaxID=1211323 RepID=A0ABP9W9X7_9DEIO
MSPATLPSRVQARLAALSRYERLHTPPEEPLERLTRLAAHTFGVPVALIHSAADQQQLFRSWYGHPATGPEGAFCAHALQVGEPGEIVVVPDTARDPRCEGWPLPEFRFYAGVPLWTPEGRPLGSLGLMDRPPRADLTAPERLLLMDLAAVVTDACTQRLAEQALLTVQHLLEDEQRQLDLILSKTRTVVWINDLQSGAVEVKANFEALGIPPTFAPTTQQQLMSIIHAEDRSVAQGQMQRILQQGQDYELPARLVMPDGREFTTQTRAHVQRDDAGQPTQLFGVTYDVSAQQRAEQALAKSEAKLRHIIEHTQDAIYIKDHTGRYLLVNPAAAEMMNSTVEAIVGRTDGAFVDEAERVRLTRLDQQVMSTGQSVSYEYPLVFGGAPRMLLTTKFPFVEQGQVRGIVGISRDITQQKQMEQALRETNAQLEARVRERTHTLQQLNQQLQHDAFHDALTGLPNRALYMDRLEHAIQRKLNRHANNFAVLFLDFDRFKLVNDSLGHAAGDELLLGIAARLRGATAPANTVARLGGDEFVILLEDVSSRQDVERRVEALLQQFTAPFIVAGQELRSTVSIGVTLCEQTYTSAEDALRDADIAMYRAKSERRGGYAIFEPAMRERQIALMNLQRDLRKAVEYGELLVHYQPIVALADRSVLGFEALVRWQHPRHGLISPGEFIPLAEESGLICEIDLWVLREACQQVGTWMNELGTPLTLNVNLSARHFEQPDVVGQVQHVLGETGFPARHLRLEITERLLVSGSSASLDTLKQLQALGIGVVVDDFGTGYSSLSYLQRLPLDGLKIDRSFMSMVTQEPEVLRTIVNLGRHLELHVVAEGIEEEQQLHHLQEMACQLGQGYLFGRPLAPEGARQLLQEPGSLS